jgi:YggT family protein
VIAQAIAFVVDAIASLFILAALLRFWMQALRAPARNPIAYFSMALTDFAVKPLRRVVPGLFRLDLASLLVALLFEYVDQLILVALAGISPFENPAVASVVLFLAFVKLIRLTIYIFMGAIIVQAVLSWVAPYHPVAPFFDALAAPLLRPVRKVIPPIGGVDITPVFILIFLQLLLNFLVTWLEHTAAVMMSQALL